MFLEKNKTKHKTGVLDKSATTIITQSWETFQVKSINYYLKILPYCYSKH